MNFIEDLIPDFNELDNSNLTDDAVIEDTSTEDNVDDNDISTDEPVVYENGDDDATAAFNVMFKTELFNEEDKKKFDGSWESLEELRNELPNRVIKSAIAQMPETAQKLLFLVNNEGENLTPDKLKTFVAAFVDDNTTEDIDITDNDTAREYLEQHYRAKGLSDKNITRLLDQAEDDDELLDQAKEAYEAENKNKPSKQDKLLEEQNQKIAAQKTFQDNLIQEMNEQKYSNTAKQRTMNTLKNFKNITNKIFANPKALVQFVDFAAFYDEKTNTFDLDSYSKRFDSKVAQTMRGNIVRETFKQSSTGSPRKGEINVDDIIFKLK